MILILTTVDNKETAVKIGRGLLEEKLIACCNFFPVESAYLWEGKIVEEGEFLLILKTKAANFKKVEEFIKKNHTYKVPEIVVIKASQVNQPYLNWLNGVISIKEKD